MKFVLAAVIASLSFAVAQPAAAALTVGEPAPEFSAPGAKGGKTVTVDLAELLKRGPVVIYFFPSAFTEGGGAREFAANIEKFQAASATVVGVSRDSVATLMRFSADECAGKFPVVSANESVVNAFDVNDGATFNTRTTYVVLPSGKIGFVNNDPEESGHADSALAFLQRTKK